MAEFVVATANDLRESGQVGSEFASDLWRIDFDDELEIRFRLTLRGHAVVCYHATRLLPHEIRDIRRSGLRVLSDRLRSIKLAGALQEHSDIVEEGDVELLLRSGPLDWQRTGGVRNGYLCFVTPWTAVAADHNGLRNLLDRWGGEAIGWTTGETARCEEVLKALDGRSVPSLVEFALEIEHFPQTCSLWIVPVGMELGLTDPWTESRARVSIPPESVIRVLTEGEPDWPDSI